MRPVLGILACAAVVGCADRAPADGTGAPPAAPGDGTTPAAPGAASDMWPADEADGISFRRQREARLTGAAAPEIISVTAAGPRYDTLDIRLVIENAAGDTLWSDEWNSAYYFYYDPAEGKTRFEIARIVQAHVDTLLHDSRISERDVPEPMSRADWGDLFRESTRYHLAELDWRNRAGLRAAEQTPREAWDRIVVENVAPARVGVVLAEVRAGPTYWYYAGGEASYIIGWSEREHAFVRIFSCC